MPTPPTSQERYHSGLRAAHVYVRDTLCLPIGLRIIENATRDGSLPHMRIGRSFLYSEADLDDWVTSLKVGGTR